jgi:hypothetical protein
LEQVEKALAQQLATKVIVADVSTGVCTARHLVPPGTDICLSIGDIRALVGKGRAREWVPIPWPSFSVFLPRQASEFPRRPLLGISVNNPLITLIDVFTKSP